MRGRANKLLSLSLFLYDFSCAYLDFEIAKLYLKVPFDNLPIERRQLAARADPSRETQKIYISNYFCTC